MLVSLFYYLNVTPELAAVVEVATTVLLISTGIVTLAPESTPSTVIEVINVLLVPNKVVELIAVRENDWPLTDCESEVLLNGRACEI